MALEVVGWWLWWFFCMNRTQYVPGKTTSERQLIHACSTSLSSPVLTRMTRIDTKSWNWSTYQGRPGKVMLDAIFCVLFLRRIIICHSNCFRNSTCQDLPLLARSRCHVNIKGSPLHSSHWWCWVFNVLQRKTIFPILTCDHFITVFGMFSVLDPAGLPCFLWAELSEGVCWCDRQPGLALHGQIYRYSEIIWDNLRSCLLQAQRLAVACLEGCAKRFRWNEIKGRGIL